MSKFFWLNWLIVLTRMYLRNSSSVCIFNLSFIIPYAFASMVVILTNDSICALLVTKVELYLASASLTTTGALILAWLICVYISMITFCCVCFTVILS